MDYKKFHILLYILLSILFCLARTSYTPDEWNSVWDEKADQGMRSHLVVRGTGNAVITAMSGTALVKNLPEISNRLGEWTRRMAGSRSEIRKVLATSEGRDYLRKYFDKYVNEGSFDEWLEKARDFKLSKDLNFEAHHVIPVKVLENNPELQRLLRENNFDFNGMENAIPLQKKSKMYDMNGHGNHPRYDRFLESEINTILNNKGLNNTFKYEEIQKTINRAKKKLEIDVLLGDKSVNDIISW